MVLALLSKGHILHFNQSPFIALTVCPLATNRNNPPRKDQNTLRSMWPISQIMMWSVRGEVMVIISFMKDLIAWHATTFKEPDNVCVLGQGYITTSIFMIITAKHVITLFIWNRPPVFLVCCQQLEWMQLGELDSRRIKYFSTHLLPKQIFN